MEGEKAQKGVEERHQEGWRDKELEPRLGVGWGGEKIEALEAGNLPRASLLRFPQRKGNPRKPLWAPFVCSRPGSDDAVDLVFKQWVCSLLGWGRGLLVILKPADWIEFRLL